MLFALFIQFPDAACQTIFWSYIEANGIDPATNLPSNGSPPWAGRAQDMDCQMAGCTP